MISKLSAAALFTAFASLSAFAPSALKNKIEKQENIRPYIYSGTAESIFKVDNATSKVTWLSKKATSDHDGQIKLSSGQLLVENSVLKGGNFEIDMNTISCDDVTDAKSNEKLLNTLKNESFFNTVKFPKASFVITSAKKTSGSQYLIKGKLTIKGITNDSSFPATISIADKKLNAVAKIVFDRTKFDIKYSSKNFFENLGDKAIYDNVDITVNLNAVAP
ncbi:YceI family protein [Pedobacter antarcticus]|uniref:YceI family protein n=1 Tax=Pedobacter antarcticus TaxID=34086 RepID=UPI00292CE2F5|nr:YceI family protein [Pedobacter antarcticus]